MSAETKPGRISGATQTAAFVIERNARRLVIVGSFVLMLAFFFGAGRLLSGLEDLVGRGPILAIQLVFMAFAGISQFMLLMWFLSRPRKYVVLPTDKQVGLSFADYRGQPDLLDHAQSLVRILRGVKEFEQRGGEAPKGMLLAGSPGTGKTYLASTIAAEANLPFIYIDSSSLSSMWMGVDALIVVSLFRQARSLGRRFAAPGTPGACILFMDEIDSIGTSRSSQRSGGIGLGGGGFMGGGRFALNTLLNQMDSMGAHVEDRWKYRLLRWLGVVRGPVAAKPTIFVIGATNLPGVLDPALTRPGRLDRMLTVYPPDLDGRRDIITYYLSKKAHVADMPIELMVSDSVGWSPVQIKTIINEALIIAHDNGRAELDYRDWLRARDNRFLGLRQPIRSMSAEDRRAIAYHEAGHAVVAHYAQPENRTLKASIVRMGDALGVVQRSPRDERHTRHASQIETDIMVSLGSRAVEEEILHTKMTGAGQDMATASLFALGYVGSYAMGPRLLTMPSSPERLEADAEALLDALMKETRRLVHDKRAAIDALAAALIEREELIGSELDAVFAAAEAAHPGLRKPFVRRPLRLPPPKATPVVVAQTATPAATGNCSHWS